MQLLLSVHGGLDTEEAIIDIATPLFRGEYFEAGFFRSESRLFLLEDFFS